MVEQTEISNSLVKTIPETDTQVMAFYEQALGLQKWAETRVISTLEDMKPANDDLVIIRRLKKAMEERRKSYLQPFQDHIKETNDAFKKLMEPVERADKITGDKMLAFNAEQGRIRREQELINDLRRAADEAEKALHPDVIIEPVTLVEVIPEMTGKTRTEVGSTGMRDNWKWEVVDFALLPDIYKTVNPAALTPAVKASKGKIAIPGVRQFNEPILATGR